MEFPLLSQDIYALLRLHLARVRDVIIPGISLADCRVGSTLIAASVAFVCAMQAVPLLRFCRQLRTLDVSAVFADRLGALLPRAA